MPHSITRRQPHRALLRSIGSPSPPRGACVSSDRISEQNSASSAVSQRSFPEDARWNAERQAVEFGVEIGEYRGVVRVPRRVFQRLLPERPTPQRPRFESIAERKLRRRQLTDDGNVEISGRDLGYCWR